MNDDQAERLVKNLDHIYWAITIAGWILAAIAGSTCAQQALQ